MRRRRPRGSARRLVGPGLDAIGYRGLLPFDCLPPKDLHEADHIEPVFEGRKNLLAILPATDNEAK